MKKLLTGILATATCFTCLAFAACGGDKDKSNLTAAADFITDLYKDQNEKVRADYDVASKVVIDGVTYTITWSVDVADGVKIVAGESKTTIDLNELLKEDLNYVLTATIKAPNGETTTVTFNRVVEAAPMMVPAPIQTTPTDGTEYMLYMYHVTKKQDFYFTGKMSGYYFGSTNDYAEAVTVKAVREGETYFHLTFEDENNVTQYIGVKNAFSNGSWHNNIVFQADTELNGAAGNFLWRFNPDYKVMTTEVKDVKSGNDENTTEKEDKTFYMGTYSTHSTFSVSEISKISNSDSCLARLVTMMDRSEVDEDTKIAQTLLEVSPALTYVGEDTVTLATQGITYPDVTIAWEVKEGGSATIADGVMTLANPAAETEVTLSVTLACGDIDETVEVTFTHKPAVVGIPAAGSTLTIAEAIELGNKFEEDSYTDGKYYVVGEITEVYNTTFGNMKIKDSEGNIFTIYGTYDETGDVRYDDMETKPVAGDTVKVYGAIGKHNDPQMKNAWIVEHTPNANPAPEYDTPEEIVDAAYALENSTDLGEYTLTGVITKIDTPYSTDYKNITVTIIVDGREDKPVQCFRLAGTGADTLAVGNTVTVKGTLSKYYTGAVQFKLGTTIVKVDTETAISDMAKVVIEKESLSVPESVKEAGEVALTTVGATYTNVAISWASNNACAVVESGKVTFTLPTEATSVTLTATIICGNAEKEYTYNVAVAAAPVAGSTTVTYDASVLGSDTLSSIPAEIKLDDNITFISAKETGSSTPAYNKDGSIRIYKNNSFTISCAANYKIISVTITATGSGNAIKPDRVTATNATVAWDENKTTVLTPTDATADIVILNSYADNQQIRITDIVVVYAEV